MKLTDALLHYLSQEDEEAQKEAAFLVAAAAREARVPTWCWYEDRDEEEPLKLVVDLPFGCICLPLPVLHERPEGVVRDWPQELATIARHLAARTLI